MTIDINIESKLLIALHKCVNHLDKNTSEIAQKEGLTFGQFMVLEALYSKGDMSIGTVMKKILSSVGTISVIVNNLVKNNYVERIEDSNDRRVTILHLTENGREVVGRVIKINDNMIRESFKLLNEMEKTNLVNILKKIGGYYGENSSKES